MKNPALADEFHLVAPDYPGFGNSSMPTVDQFEYSFDQLADVENRIKEGKNTLRWDKISCQRFEANQARLKMGVRIAKSIARPQ